MPSHARILLALCAAAVALETAKGEAPAGGGRRSRGGRREARQASRASGQDAAGPRLPSLDRLPTRAPLPSSNVSAGTWALQPPRHSRVSDATRPCPVVHVQLQCPRQPPTRAATLSPWACGGATPSLRLSMTMPLPSGTVSGASYQAGGRRRETPGGRRGACTRYGWGVLPCRAKPVRSAPRRRRCCDAAPAVRPTHRPRRSHVPKLGVRPSGASWQLLRGPGQHPLWRNLSSAPKGPLCELNVVDLAAGTNSWANSPDACPQPGVRMRVDLLFK